MITAIGRMAREMEPIGAIAIGMVPIGVASIEMGPIGEILVEPHAPSAAAIWKGAMEPTSSLALTVGPALSSMTPRHANKE